MEGLRRLGSLGLGLRILGSLAVSFGVQDSCSSVLFCFLGQGSRTFSS